MKVTFFILLAYLLGSIPTGLWIGQKFYGKNLRELGSGNTGTTNTFRILGARAGIITLLVDILKGTLATLLPIWFMVEGISPIVIGFFAVIGHILPIFAGFKGGKAVATSAGVLLGFSPLFLLFFSLIFFISLYLFSMISLSSVIVALLSLVGIALFPALDFILIDYDPIFSLVVALFSAIILIRHKDNITRILNKTENLVPFGLNLTKQRKP